ITTRSRKRARADRPGVGFSLLAVLGGAVGAADGAPADDMKNPSLRANEGTVPDRGAWEPISVRAEKKASAFGRSPGSWIANRIESPPPSPSPTVFRRVGREDGLHIQWRDRAGF